MTHQIGETHIVYRLKMLAPPGDLLALSKSSRMANRERVSYLRHWSGSRPAWSWTGLPEDTLECIKTSIGASFRSRKEWRQGLRSKAVKMAMAESAVYGRDIRVLLIEQVNVLENCSCHGRPQWLIQSEKVVRQVWPEPTVLDKLAAI